MNADVTTVRHAFDVICDHYRVPPQPRTREWDFIVRNYTQKHRYYHTLTHIAAMIRDIDALKPTAADRVALYAFAVYHDIVYETAPLERARQNEMRSANLARAFMTSANAPGFESERLAQRIHASQKHDIDPKRDFWGAAAMDIDMSILAARPRAYRRYAGQIRLEFGHLADDVFFPARMNMFLAPTLRRERIFLTQKAQDKWEQPARANIAAEIAAIRKRGYALAA